MQNDHENLSLSSRINEGVQKNRKLIFVILGSIVVLLIAAVVSLSLMDVLRKKAISGADELTARYETLRPTIGENSDAVGVETLLDDLNVFAQKHSGFAGGKAWSLIGSIHAAKNEWAEAETAWRQAAKIASKTYLAPLALFDAAASAEKQGKNREAVDLYTQSVSSPAAFPAAPRAQFSIGRLLEGLNETDAAIEAYREVVAKWPNDNSGYANLARSRILALEAGIGFSAESRGSRN